jgi:hypothetical protein
MSQITLETAVEVVPAVPAVTTTEITILEIRENYGWNYDPTQPGGNFGPGRPQSVEATVLLNAERGVQRTLMVWEGDDYLAVRGTWTDADLAAKIEQILTAA